MRALGLLLLWAACLILALGGGWPVAWLVVYALGLLLVVSWLWAHLDVAGLVMVRTIAPQRPCRGIRPSPACRGATVPRGWDSPRIPPSGQAPERLYVGDALLERWELKPRTWFARWWPRIALELRDGSDLPGHSAGHVMSLWPGRSRAWEIRTTCHRRGRFTLGPVWVCSSDPFGIVRVWRRLSDERSLLVRPRPIPIPGAPQLGTVEAASSLAASGRGTSSQALTIRDYLPGDPLNRVHWPSTARLGSLMARDLESESTGQVWLAVDLHADVQAGMAPESTDEYAVAAAASLAGYLLGHGRPVGFVSQWATLPAAGVGQLDRLLDLFAVLRPTSPLPLADLLRAEASRFGRGSTLLVISPSTDERWPGVCGGLRASGVRTMALLVEAATFGAGPSPLLIAGTLAAHRMPFGLLKCGAPMELALGRLVGTVRA